MSLLIRFFRRSLRRWERRSSVTKRQLFVIITFILTVGLVLTQLVSVELRYPLVAGLALLTYLLSAFALREDLQTVEWLTLLTLPTLFTAAVGLFYFFFSVLWLS